MKSVESFSPSNHKTKNKQVDDKELQTIVIVFCKLEAARDTLYKIKPKLNHWFTCVIEQLTAVAAGAKAVAACEVKDVAVLSAA